MRITKRIIEETYAAYRLNYPVEAAMKMTAKVLNLELAIVKIILGFDHGTC